MLEVTNTGISMYMQAVLEVTNAGIRIYMPAVLEVTNANIHIHVCPPQHSKYITK